MIFLLISRFKILQDSSKDKVEEFIDNNDLQIRPEYGVFPSRKYDSAKIWGCSNKINKIMEHKNEN